MKKNQFISYGYYSYYSDSSYIYHTDPKNLSDLECHCEAEEKLDTINFKECKVLGDYFGALALFADPKSRLSIDPVSTIVQSGQYGNLKITDNEASIVSELSTTLSSLLTTNYKSNQIKKFILLHHDSVAPLINYLEIRGKELSAKIQNLQMILEQQTLLMIHYSEKKDVKWAIVLSYEQKNDQLNKILAEYEDRELAYEKVKKGGDLIYQNVDELQSEIFKKKLNSAIRDLILNSGLNK